MRTKSQFFLFHNEFCITLLEFLKSQDYISYMKNFDLLTLTLFKIEDQRNKQKFKYPLIYTTLRNS